MAGSNAAVNCLKFMLLIFNTVLWAAGTAIFALGIYMVAEFNKYMEVDPNNRITPTVAYVFIGIGLIVALLGIVACCCTVGGNTFLLYLYSVLLVIFFLAQLSCGIAWFVFRDNIHDAYFERLNASFSHYEEGGKYAELIDSLQHTLKCCGIANYTDWQHAPHHQVPVSCCKNDTSVPCDTAVVANIYTDGCYDTVVDYFDITIKAVGGVTLGIAFFNMLGFVLSCCLAKNIKKLQEYQPL